MRTRALFPFEIIRLLAWLAVAIAGGVCEGQAPPPVQVPANAGGDYAVTQVGPHSRVWQNSAGQSVTEIATGMNFWNGQAWVPSDPSFVVSGDQTSFVANKIQDPTTLAANINTQRAVTAVTPNGVTLQSTPISIMLYDTASGQSVVVAAITNSTGVMVDAQHIVYTNAFVGGTFSASVVYSLPDTGSFHQDVIFTGFDPGFDPTVWGFAANSTNTLQIQIWTEFYNPPQPQVQERDLYIEQDPNVRASMASPDFIDHTLDFGNYVFGPGRCYTLAANAGSSGVTVAKDWVASDGRTFLVESISYKSIAGSLQGLPPPQVRTASIGHPAHANTRMAAATSIPRLKDSKERRSNWSKATKVAGLVPRGLDVDYIAVVSSSREPKLYSSDTTYFVSGPVFETAPVTMEAAVFKYPSSAGYIEIESTLTLITTNYRTAIFTSADDSTAGATLSASIWSGYTGTPQNHQYGSIGLWLNTSATVSLNNLRFCFLSTALQINADTSQQFLSVSHTELVDCNEGIYVNGGNGSNTNASLNFYVYNCLITDLGTPFEIGGILLTNGAGCNCTVDGCTNLLKVDAGVSGKLAFTNSIFSTLTSKGTLGSLTLTGSSNVFYNSSGTTFGTFNTLPSSPYVPAGAGNYYINGNSPYLTDGTVNVPASLLSQLKMKTTQAPYYITNPITFSTALTPVVQRDAAGTELGWHYDPVDFLISCVVRPNTTLTLTNGVALAYYSSEGILMLDRAVLDSQGTPNQRNYLVYYNLVQEQPVSLSAVPLAQAVPIIPDPTTTAPAISLRLTTICAPTGETNLLTTGPGLTISTLTMRDCEIYGSGAVLQMTENYAPAPLVQLINNVFYRVPFAISNFATNIVFNNLFYGTTNYITNTTVGGTLTTNTSTLVSIIHVSGYPSSNTNQNNVYDGVAVWIDGVTNHNAYLHGGTNLVGTNSTDIAANVAWVAGPLGGFYQPSGSPLLNEGSVSAANLGLYHYTVLTSEAIEGDSTVSLGYHYVALTNSGTPLDYNNDGVPDYLEDVNGDGTNDNVESWSVNTSVWIGTQPVNQYAVAGTPATFSVTAYGTGTLTYQWYKGGSSIGGATLSSYTIASVGSGDVASYAVVVNGTATSGSATLTLVIPPQITNISPALTTPYWFQTNYDTLSLSVTNAQCGAATPAFYSQYLDSYLYNLPVYEWEYNGISVPSSASTGTNVVYIMTNDQPTVVVSNPAGSTNIAWTNVFVAAPGMVEAWGSDASGECNRPVALTNAIAIAAGEYQSVAVTDAGSIVQWGQYYNGVNFYSVTDAIYSTQPPTGGVAAVAAGQGHALALMTNGTVTAWGLTGWPGAEIPAGQNLTNIVAIACGFNFSLVLSNNGTIFAWGDNTWGQTNIPSSYRTNNVAISASGTHAFSLQSNGMVLYWGYSDNPYTNPPNSLLTNVTAGIASGTNVDMALLSNGTVVAWGNNSYGQTNVPAAINGNAMSIAAGDNHCVALLNNGSVVAWGNDSSGQTNVPQFNPAYPVNVKLLAAGGNHTLAAIWSPLVQYPVNVANDLLLIYNTNSIDSWNVCEYYRTNRPMVSAANELGIGCTTNETFLPGDYTNIFAAQVTNWLNLNPTKRPQYVILFPFLPSRVNVNTNAGVYDETNGDYFPSVQYQLNHWCSTNWRPFVTSINMNGYGGTTDCIQYIDKLASIGSNSPEGRVLLSGRAGGYGNANFYLDDTESGYDGAEIGGFAVQPLIQDGLSSSAIFYTNDIPDCGTLACHITIGTNVAGYMCWGVHSSLGIDYAVDGEVSWKGHSGWYVIQTIESFNGQRQGIAGNFLSWYEATSFNGTNYSNTPVAAISNVDEPLEPGPSYSAIYFGLWEGGMSSAICAWNDVNSQYFQAIGDPLVTK